MIGRNWPWLVGTLLLASCVSKPMEQKEGAGPADAESSRTTSVAKPHQPSTAAAESLPPLRARLATHIDSLANAGGTNSRVVFTPGNRWSVGYIFRQLHALRVPVRLDTFGTPRRNGRDGRLANVVAVVPGETDSVVVLCAHLDASASRDPGWKARWETAPAPGATDNASGIAALIEIVRKVAAAQPRYTLIAVASNAEEKNPEYSGHHHGSRAVANWLRREGKKVRGVVVMDMVGWSPNGAQTMLFADARSRPLATLLRKLNDSLKTGLAIAATIAPCRHSDNESFANAGFPAVLFMESCTPWRATGLRPRNPTYHTRRDLPPTVNLSVTEGVVELVAQWVAGDRPR